MTALASPILERDFSHSPTLAAVQKEAIRMATKETDLMLAEKIQGDFDSGKISRECFNQAKGSMDLESIFAKKEYPKQRVVTNSKGVTLETKSANELWSKVEQIPVTGMKAGIYLLG